MFFFFFFIILVTRHSGSKCFLRFSFDAPSCFLYRSDVLWTLWFPLCFLKCWVCASHTALRSLSYTVDSCLNVSDPHTAFGRTSGLHRESCAAECRGIKKGGLYYSRAIGKVAILSLFFFLLFFYVKAIHQSLIQHSSISVVAYIRKLGDCSGVGSEISLLWASPHFKTGCSPPPRQQRELFQSDSMEERSSWEM